MKKTKQILSLFLSVCMILTCMVGMSVTAGADTAVLKTFTPENFYYQFSDDISGDVTKITKVEALIDIDTFSWGHIQTGVGGGETTQSAQLNTMSTNIPGVALYTYNGTMTTANYAQVLLCGNGRLLALKVTYSDSTPESMGNWDVPEFKAPTANTGLTANGSAQALVSEGVITSGTGTIEYSLDNSNWSTDIPKGTDAGDYTVYYRVKYGNEYYQPLYNGIQVTIGEPSTPPPVVITKYKITMSNGGKAKVDGAVVTEAAEGAAVTIVADEPVSGTEFNGWTSTPEVSFANASAATTTFTMPAADVEITASYQTTAPEPTHTWGGTSYQWSLNNNIVVATYRCIDDPSLTIKETAYTTSEVTMQPTATTWGETTYTAVFTDPVFTTQRKAVQDIPPVAPAPAPAPVYPSYPAYDPYYAPAGSAPVFASPAPYHSPIEGKHIRSRYDGKGNIILSWDEVDIADDYIVYLIQNGKAKKLTTTDDLSYTYTGAKAGTSYTFMVKYHVGSSVSRASESYRTTVKTAGKKPIVTAAVNDGYILLTWGKVTNAEEYAVYQQNENGRLKKLGTTTDTSFRVDTVPGETYTFAVKAYVDGEWTTVNRSDLVYVTAE